MNCSNCGAAMTLVESRRYFRCDHCGAYYFPETVEADGIRVLGQSAEAPRCPVCTIGMTHAVLDGEFPIEFCVRCRGLLLSRPAFALVTTKRRAWAATPPSEPVPFDRQELHRRLVCPKCGSHFDTYPHLGPGNVVIDNCARCDLIWLDFGEMRRIEDAPGKDRGTKHVPRIDEDFIRSGGAAPRGDNDREGAGSEAADPLGLLLDVIFER